MSEATPRKDRPSPSDPTIDAAPLQADPTPYTEPSSADAGQPAVALVEGSRPELTQETYVLLQRRLRLAAALLFVGFAVFLARHLVQTDLALPGGRLLFFFHIALTAVLGLVSAWIYSARDVEPRWLRAAELVIFGLPAIFFALLQYAMMLRACDRGYLYFPEGCWLILIYTYALFIPNTLRRAAIVIGMMAAAPVLLLIGMVVLHPAVGQVCTTGQIVSFPLMLILAAIGSIFGVDTIGTLRRQAFQARQLGQYRLTRRIGSGGMGEVYLAEHQLLKRPCVVKLIRPDKAGDPRSLARFQREVRATAKLSHWNTVEIFDYGHAEDGTFYYVMEYLPGMNLGEIVERFGPLPPERAIHFLVQACDALGEAHAAGLIHRDIKPGNIFAAQRGGFYDVAKLLDFGLVKPLVDDEPPVHLTTEGAITGSPLFMSPEQAVGDREPDARSDIYSLGAVAYYLVTGRPPFEGDKPLKVLIAHAHNDVVPPSQLRPGLPTDLEQVILRCLAKDPANRFQTAAELADALAACRAADNWTRAMAAQWWQRQEEYMPVA